jgi:hypothetical protein
MMAAMIDATVPRHTERFFYFGFFWARGASGRCAPS